MRNWIIPSAVILAGLGTACNKGPQQPPEHKPSATHHAAGHVHSTTHVPPPTPVRPITAAEVNAKVEAYFKLADRQRSDNVRPRTINWEDEQSRQKFPAELLGPKVGALGHLYHPMTIQQRIDDRSALVTVEIGNSSPHMWAGQPCRDYRKQLLLLQGIDLRNHVDGDQFESSWVMQITGTKTYTTSPGSTKTLYVLEPVDTETQKKIDKEIEFRAKLYSK